jgi:hypothetical protein
MKAAIDLEVGGGRLRVFGMERLGDVRLEAYAGSDVRLMVVASTDDLFEAPGAHLCFEMALGSRGWLSGVRCDHLPAFSLDLAPVAHWGADGLQQGFRLDVACLRPVSVPLTTAAMLLGCGLTPSEALERVREAIPDTLTVPDDEITISVAAEHLVAHRDLQRRRAALRAAGRSPWEAQ